jgi:hypothetical protein
MCLSANSIRYVYANSLFIRQETTSVAESGIYVDKLKIFEATEADRTLHIKGDEVIIYHPKNKKEQRRYNPRTEMKLTVPAGYAVRVVKAWVAWE